MKKINREELHSIFIGIRSGNELEFNKLYEKYKNLVYGVAFSILKNKEDSEETMQIVFMQIFKQEKEKLPKQNEASWLYTVTKNKAISLLRQRKESIDIEEIYEIKDSSKDIDYVVDRIEFNNLINKLNYTEKEIVSLKILSNFSFSEIAKLLGKPLGTIKWKYYKAVKTIKILISNFALFIITFIIGIKTINIEDRKQEREVKKEEITEETKDELDIDNTEKKKEEADITESLREETKKDESQIKQETIIPNNEQENSYNNYIGIGILSISAIFLIITIIFSIFLIKYKPIIKFKTSK